MGADGFMRATMRATLAALMGLALLAGSAARATAQGTAEAPRVDATVIFLVRHGETAPDGTRDPPLSPEGENRAERLSAVLRDAALDAILTTDYARTRGTAAPVAVATGLEPARYDPAALSALAARLRSRGGRILVVGHSNTTPALVEALAGDPGPPIDEAEHDRLYVLVIEGETVRTIRLRY